MIEALKFFFSNNAKSSFPGNLIVILLLYTGCAGSGQSNDSLKSTAITLESIEGNNDTIRFHIGSPLFLRMNINTRLACEAFNGHPFFFDEKGVQIGWGFEEVQDTLVLGGEEGSCERFLMLTSESSNLLAEGYYPMSVALLIDEKSELRSDTIVLHPVHASGADERSYSRFIIEQIISRSPLLDDPVTLRELFASHLPQSFASDVYKAVIFYRGGDMFGAEEALTEAEKKMMTPVGELSVGARRLYNELKRRISNDTK